MRNVAPELIWRAARASAADCRSSRAVRSSSPPAISSRPRSRSSSSTASRAGSSCVRPILPPEHLPSVIADAEVDAIVTGPDGATERSALGVDLRGRPAALRSRRGADEPRRTPRRPNGCCSPPAPPARRRWSCTASPGLTGAIKRDAGRDGPWSGARSTTSAAMAACRSSSARVLDGGSLVLSSAEEPVGDHLVRLGRARRHPPVRHAVALAPRADEPVGPRDLAALCPALRRDRRPGDPRQSARLLSAGARSATPMRRPRPASASRSTTAARVFRRA